MLMWEDCAYKFFNYLSFGLILALWSENRSALAPLPSNIMAVPTWLFSRPELRAIQQYCDVDTVSLLKPSILIK